MIDRAHDTRVATSDESRALRAFRAVHRLLVGEHDARRLVVGVCSELVRALECESAWVALRADDGLLAPADDSGPSAPFELIAVGLDPSRETELRRALEQVPESAAAPGRSAGVRPGALAAPLEFEGRSYGSLGADPASGREPSELERQVFVELASSLACALDAIRASHFHSRTLKRERDQHTLALQASGQGSYDFDVRTGRVSVSPEYATILGYAPGEFDETAEAWAERTHPDDREPSATAFIQALTGVVDSYRIECRQRTKSGAWRWVLSQGRVVERTAADEPTRLIGTISDISEQKAAEERLQERELLLSEAQRIAQLGYWTFDRVDGSLRWSDETHRIFGFRQGEFDGTYEAFLAAVHPEDRARVDDAYSESVRAGRRDYESVHRLVRRDTGEIRHAFERCVHQVDAAGQLLRSIGVVQDVTDRVNAMHELEAVGTRLRESNEQLELRVAERTRELERQAAALEASLEAVGIHREGRWVYRNEAFDELFGAIDVHRPWRSLFEPASRGAVPLELTSSAGVWTGHAEARASDGSTFEADVEVSHLADGSTVLVVRDITEHSRALRSLAEREAKYRGLMEGAGDAILTATIDGQVVEANRRAETLLGYEPEALASMRLDQLYAPDTSARHGALFEQMARRELDAASDVAILHRDGSTLHVDITANVIDLGPGPLLITSFRDATGRRASERKLIELSEQLAMSLEAGQIGRWTYDLRTNDLSWDERMYELYGLSPGDFDLTYAAWQDLVLPEERGPLEAAFRQALAETRSFDARFDARAADGTVKTIQTKAMILADSSGAAERVFGINYDISSLVERERTLEQLNRQLELATRQKDEFLANMSHELRTPLNAILGMSESLTMGVYGEIDDRQRHAVSRIEESGRHLLSLINDILDLAKIEAGRVELSMEAVRIAELASSVLRLMEPVAQTKGIRLASAFDPDVSTLSADPRRLRQILLNLLSNALKFTESGGQVTISTEADPERRRLHVHVTDTGEGISQEAQSRLFKPFSQLESTLTRRHGGTGLGLSIVKHLAEMHGGEVALRSSPGQGSRFTVSLPWSRLRSDAPGAMEAKRLSVAPGPSLAAPAASRVLIVEDNESNIVLVRDFLVAERYEVAVARTGTQGVALAESESFDVILMDVQMPEMDGFEATRRIRRLEGHRRTPIIALTSFAMPGDRERCIAAGMSDYMAKPLSLRALNQLIKSSLRRTTEGGIDE